MLFNTVERNVHCDEVTTRVDAGVGAGKIRLWTSDGGTLLAELPMDATNAFTASGAQGSLGIGSQPATTGLAWLNAPLSVTDPTPVAGGVCGFVEFTDSDNNRRWAATPGLIGSGAGLELSTLTIDTGVAVTASNGQINFPAGAL